MIRDYRQHFETYILPKFKDVRLLAIGTGYLTEFRVELLRRGLSVKTCRNIIDGSLRALYRDARAELDALKGRDPFIDIHWPAVERQKPDPFTAEERDHILAFFREREPFYYPWVLTPFVTGTRPSEASALLVTDVDPERCEISISKSRHLGADSSPKTPKSCRMIRVPRDAIEALLTLPSWSLATARLFLNKFGDPLDANQWARVYWPRVLKGLGIRYRKFYATRHTFITEMVKRGENLKAIADYCGTSVMMIEQDYCGTLTLSDRTISAPEWAKPTKGLVVPTGIEPVLPT
ncbi:MAG: tyrosine-type recombinase/integrase [Deltaproteobacteria bacterium]|nr:tyrosine-type recombinase/integrase [Deltaproteobacteria bacterium]